MNNLSLSARIAVLASSLLAAGEALRAEEPDVEAEAARIVAQYKGQFTQPPRVIPTGKTPDAPLLGNGDVGVAVAGPADRQQFYIAKNDFWSWTARCVKTVGRVGISIPALAGGSYHQQQDLFSAEVRGTFAKEDLKVKLRSFVAATENLLVTEVGCEGARPVPVVVTHECGPAGGGIGRALLTESAHPINIGREQHGGGRWTFNGRIDDVRIYGRALSPQQIKALAEGQDVSEGLVRHWKFDEGQGSSTQDSAANTSAEIHHGTWAEGTSGKALGFDGRQGHVDGGKLRLAGQVTLSAWIYTDAFDPVANYILSKGAWNQAYSLGLSSGKLRFAVGNHYVQTSKPLLTGRWLHVAGTYDGVRTKVFIGGKDSAQPDGGERGFDGDVLWFIRAADPSDTENRRTVAVATRVIGAAVTHEDGVLRFDLTPNNSVYLATSILSDLDGEDCRTAAVQRLGSVTRATLATLGREQRQWWQRFWAESFVEIGDPLLEKFYYGSHYLMASCSRAGKVPPGLFGNWVTTDRPAWRGDFHLNYNHEAPFWGLYSSNHLEVAGSYEAPILDAMPTGRENARELLDCRGVYYPVGLGPWGMISAGIFMGQKSNAAYAATNMVMRWYHTYDLEYARQVYPYLVEVANFWEDYLKFEDGRYVIYNDAIHENHTPQDFNPLLSLGLVRMVFRAVIDVSTELGVDAQRHAKWRHVLQHLSEYPLQERGGKTVFRYSERGQDWFGSNTLGIQHIWPAGQIGLDSQPKLLEISRDTITVLNRWTDYNGFPTFYTAAARVGYDPAVILKHLRIQCRRHSFPNLHIFHGGGGVEELSGVTSSINEMLLQGHEGVLRLFPVWPKETDARFGNLRARGAFLVSSELKDGRVQYVLIASEKGRDCTVVNPWPEKAVTLRRNGAKVETVSGQRFTFNTRKGERIELWSGRPSR